MKRSHLAAIACVAVALSASVPAMAAPDTSSADPSGATPAPAVEGSAWVLASLPGKTRPPGPTPTLRFDAGRAVGSDGCNRYTAPYTVTGTALEIGPRAASTMRACAAETMEQAEAFLAALVRERGFRRTADVLTLTGADGKDVATLAAQSQALAGSLWRAVAINNGREAVVSVVDDSTVTMGFGANARVSGSTGCNGYSAPFDQTGTRLRIGTATTAGRVCASAALTSQEEAFLKALGTVATLRVEDDRLELRTASDALAISLTRIPY